jgi:hypothetical protein
LVACTAGALDVIDESGMVAVAASGGSANRGARRGEPRAVEAGCVLLAAREKNTATRTVEEHDTEPPAVFSNAKAAAAPAACSADGGAPGAPTRKVYNDKPLDPVDGDRQTTTACDIGVLDEFAR